MEKEAYSLSQERITTSSASPIKWDYTCIFCDRTFDSGRALGGHQNAHRFEPRERRRTHHKRVPKKDRHPSVVPHYSLWPPPNHSLWAPNPKTECHHQGGYPVKMQDGLPPRVADHCEYEREILVARAAGLQGMGAEEGSRNGPYLNDDGVAELDLELKL